LVNGPARQKFPTTSRGIIVLGDLGHVDAHSGEVIAVENE
jgi:hypothetical protein